MACTYCYIKFISIKGDWVWMKKFPSGDIGDLKPGTSDVFEIVSNVLFRLF